MSVVINGTGSISGLSNVGGISSAQSGSVIQTVQATYGTQVSTGGTTYIDTGLSATITPQFSTSKILVIATVSYAIKASTAGAFGGLRTLRNAVVIDTGIADSTGPYPLGINAGGSTNTQQYGKYVLNYLDSPATTSATTYKVQFVGYNGSTTMVVNMADVNGTSYAYIQLMEIAA